ncbi:Hypothetical predicted protein [Lecanosticta acicola]|uniref:RNA ligase/cyclic nucleotide phosphodiesterase n=1 Tax=Lecanosticta acicola TaxID=111012 RepID=A0AAI9EEJ2_9PEZI|nr:Hypothetical predicted protein [Lecanosticta acicola]
MAAYYTFEDYSGSSTDAAKTDNPYHDLIESCNNDPSRIQVRYSSHRTNRNTQQKQKLLSSDFQGVTPDQILSKLEDPIAYPGFKDHRHCLVFWARPTQAVKNLIQLVQKELQDVVPHLWLMKPESLHMTALEITHSLTAPEIEGIVEKVSPHAQEIADFTFSHRAPVVKPCLSFDAQAFALSFLPADGEGGRAKEEDKYTYHHLRRDLFSLVQERTGVKVASRYVIPSAHLTIARFLQTADLETDGKLDHGKVKTMIDKVEEINAWLEREYWPQRGTIKEGGAWIVGEGKGLDYRKGTLWYGSGGETMRLGKGF